MTRLTPHRSHTTAASVTQPARLPRLGQQLIRDGTLPVSDVNDAVQDATRLGLPLDDILYSEHGLSRRALSLAQSEALGTQMIDPLHSPPDIRLVAQYGPAQALRDGLLPWRRLGGCTIILTASADRFDRHQAALTARFGPVRLALTTEDQMTRSITALFGAQMIARAESRVPAQESCRNWHAGAAMTGLALCLILLAVLLLLAPIATLATLTGLTVVLMALTTSVKIAAAIAGRNGLPDGPGPSDARLARLPVITLLIPLYREREIADHLLNRLMAIDYPRALLDVCLVLEKGDDTTRAALGRAKLLTWMRAITVPDGTIKTKPRALNYALDFARGALIGIYDAEDAPAPDQLRRVAQHFANADPRVACVQGILDYYNSRANWLTRCFTIEYAAWFRVVLPGFARLGLVVPLGGTTLFFRRSILEKLGGWDAHNVTEDADLGLRLARHGYRTEFVNSVTEEEANGRFWPWVKQRSRWLKGYAITYGVHMRAPRRLWRDLGPWRFFGVQVLFLGTLAQFLLSPLLWSFWLIPFGLPHPIAQILSPAGFWLVSGLFLATEIANLVIARIALRRAGKGKLWGWALSLQLYFPLATIAVYKGLLELTWKPFYWDKTAHGVLMTAAIPPPEPSAHPASVE